LAAVTGTGDNGLRAGYRYRRPADRG